MNNTAKAMNSNTYLGNSLPEDNSIVGVQLKTLKSYPDDRGFFREIIRHTDSFFQKDGTQSVQSSQSFAQWSHSRMQKDVVKAWHYHHIQYDWWYVPIGQVETVLFDNREESPTYKTKLVFKMGEKEKYGEDTHEVCVRIPPGVLHGCKVLSKEAHLFYITSEIYNPNEEGRFPFDSEIVAHNWGTGIITAENDRKTFVPTSKRALVV